MIRIKQLFIFSLLLIALMHNPLISQLNSNNLTSYDESEGARVFDVLSDRMGNIWMATESGLMKYDGYEFISFHEDPNNPQTIGSILTFSLHEDQKGNIWIGCMGLVSKYDPKTKTFKNFRLEGLSDIPENGQAYVSAIVSAENGKVFFGLDSYLGYICSFAVLYYSEEDDMIRKVSNSNNLVVNNVQTTAFDAHGTPWFRCDNGVFVVDDDGEIRRIDIPGLVDSSRTRWHFPIAFDSEGCLWTRSDITTLCSYNPDNGKLKFYALDDVCADSEEDRFLSDFVFDDQDNLWISTSSGLMYFDRLEGTFSCLNWIDDPNNLIGVVFGINVDNFGDIWAGTRDRGVLRYSRSELLKSVVAGSDDEIGLTSGWATSIVESQDGAIWVGTGGGAGIAGLNVLDPKSNALRTFPISDLEPDTRHIFAFVEDTQGSLLVSTNTGYYTFDVEANTFLPTEIHGIPDTTFVQSLYKDSDQNIWACAYDGLYVRFANIDTFRQVKLAGGTDNLQTIDLATRVLQSEVYGLWILSNAGLFLYDYESEHITRHGNDRRSENVFISQDINSLCVDSAGIVWVGTWGGGLSRYDVASGTIVNYTIDEGLPSMNIQGILEDVEGNTIWISTFDGLSRLNRETGQFTNFSIKDGIQARTFADGACLKTSGGLMVFGGSNGINIFDPGDVVRNALAPMVYITDLEIASSSSGVQASSRLIDPLGDALEIKLDHNQNSLSIDYVGIHYANPAKNQFAYKLENYDKNWRNVGNQRSAYYYNLPPGKYTFRVKASNSSGVWNEEGAMIKINIAPPWWKTWWAYGLYALCCLIGLYMIERAFRRGVIEKERALIKDKELAQAKEIEKAYVKLKTTQSQLVHAEKMASLGELTAGIAHEIQNPLNFVNNFADVSVDLLDEMNEEMAEGNKEAVDSIAADLKQNLEKINFHGQRASGIVKGMLEHSRSGEGNKEMTDLNILSDEYLRLAYHGLRAKDKSFNADFKTDLDDALPKLNVVPQEIGRVLLNLINNAFHAVRQRAKESDDDYEPTVTVSTRKKESVKAHDLAGGACVQISVKDNGSGIAKNAMDKIFQPFFTTKPTGEGTGLGLSLSYDIIKAHGGELKVETKEGEGSEFIIVLPI